MEKRQSKTTAYKIMGEIGDDVLLGLIRSASFGQEFD